MIQTVKGVFPAYVPVSSGRPTRFDFQVKLRPSLPADKASVASAEGLTGAAFVVVNPDATPSAVIAALEKVLRDIRREGLYLGLSMTGQFMHSSPPPRDMDKTKTKTETLQLALSDDALSEFKKLNRAITLNWHTLDEQKPDWDSLCAQAAGLAGKIGHTDAATLLRFLAQVVEDGFMGSTP